MMKIEDLKIQKCSVKLSIYSTAIDDDVEHFTSVGLLPTTNTKKN